MCQNGLLISWTWTSTVHIGGREVLLYVTTGKGNAELVKAGPYWIPTPCGGCTVEVHHKRVNRASNFIANCLCWSCPALSQSQYLCYSWLGFIQSSRTSCCLFQGASAELESVRSYGSSFASIVSTSCLIRKNRKVQCPHTPLNPFSLFCPSWLEDAVIKVN